MSCPQTDLARLSGGAAHMLVLCMHGAVHAAAANVHRISKYGIVSGCPAGDVKPLTAIQILSLA